MMFTFIIHAVKLEWAGFGGRAKGSGDDKHMVCNQNGIRKDLALIIAQLDSIAARLEAADTTEDESSRANTDNGLLNLEEDLAVLTNNNAGISACNSVMYNNLSHEKDILTFATTRSCCDSDILATGYKYVPEARKA
nr:unnamed protein product [Fasciola hepatica]